MYERMQQLIEGVERGARDPKCLYEGKTKEEHEKALEEARAEQDGPPAGKDEQQVLDEAQMLATARARKANLLDRMPAIAHACDGVRDARLSGEGFSR